MYARVYNTRRQNSCACQNAVTTVSGTATPRSGSHSSVSTTTTTALPVMNAIWSGAFAHKKDLKARSESAAPLMTSG